MKRLIVGLLVLVGLLVGADFGAAALAESAVSRQMRDQIGLPEDPDVRINGFPFVTQAASGHFTSIDVIADRLSVGQLEEVEIVAHLVDVEVAPGLGADVRSLRVRRADGTVRVGANDLERLIGDVERLRIETVDEDQIEQAVEDGGDPSLADIDPDRAARIVGTVDAVPGEGGETEVAVLVALGFGDGGQVRIVPRDIRRTGDSEPLPDLAAAPLAERFAVTVNPGSLPLQVTPTTLRARDGVLEISGTARNLTLGAGPTTAAER